MWGSLEDHRDLVSLDCGVLPEPRHSKRLRESTVDDDVFSRDIGFTVFSQRRTRSAISSAVVAAVRHGLFGDGLRI
jgi:hypothetical protein